MRAMVAMLWRPAPLLAQLQCAKERSGGCLSGGTACVREHAWLNSCLGTNSFPLRRTSYQSDRRILRSISIAYR